MRDSQRSKVYTAEDVWRAALPLQVRYCEPLDVCQEFLAGVWAALPGRFDDAPEVLAGRSCASADIASITLGRKFRNRPIILHELAHVLMIRDEIRAPDHGAEFCAVYVDLVDRALGTEAALGLLDAFADGKVNVSGNFTIF